MLSSCGPPKKEKSAPYIAKRKEKKKKNPGPTPFPSPPSKRTGEGLRCGSRPRRKKKPRFSGKKKALLQAGVGEKKDAGKASEVVEPAIQEKKGKKGGACAGCRPQRRRVGQARRRPRRKEPGWAVTWEEKKKEGNWCPKGERKKEEGAPQRNAARRGKESKTPNPLTLPGKKARSEGMPGSKKRKKLGRRSVRKRKKKRKNRPTGCSKRRGGGGGCGSPFSLPPREKGRGRGVDSGLLGEAQEEKEAPMWLAGGGKKRVSYKEGMVGLVPLARGKKNCRVPAPKKEKGPDQKKSPVGGAILGEKRPCAQDASEDPEKENKESSRPGRGKKGIGRRSRKKKKKRGLCPVLKKKKKKGPDVLSGPRKKKPLNNKKRKGKGERGETHYP